MLFDPLVSRRTHVTSHSAIRSPRGKLQTSPIATCCRLRAVYVWDTVVYSAGFFPFRFSLRANLVNGASKNSGLVASDLCTHSRYRTFRKRRCHTDATLPLRLLFFFTAFTSFAPTFPIFPRNSPRRSHFCGVANNIPVENRCRIMTFRMFNEGFLMSRSREGHDCLVTFVKRHLIRKLKPRFRGFPFFTRRPRWSIITFLNDIRFKHENQVLDLSYFWNNSPRVAMRGNSSRKRKSRCQVAGHVRLIDFPFFEKPLSGNY